MALYLGHVPVLTIMIIGRWKSDAFLRYIRKQVALFSENLTDRMLDVDSFFTTPEPLLLILKMAQVGVGESTIINLQSLVTNPSPGRNYENGGRGEDLCRLESRNNL
jgi:hypothetical protein